MGLVRGERDAGEGAEHGPERGDGRFGWWSAGRGTTAGGLVGWGIRPSLIGSECGSDGKFFGDDRLVVGELSERWG